MFSFGPLRVDVKIYGAAKEPLTGAPSIPVSHQGATHVFEVINLSMVPVDIEAEGALTANLVQFASGATWGPKSLDALPAHASPPPPSMPMSEPVVRPNNVGSGNESARCARARWRNNGAGGWTPWHTPPSGNFIAFVVPP
jgi:hypothetical protein